MPISKTDSLFQLVQSLTKAEKRNFKLYAKRNHTGESLKFIDLFDIICKQKEGDDNAIFSQLKEVNKAQYANLKRHLYSQIVTSLRLIHKTKRPNIQVREYLDFAYILYGKGLFLQALKLLGIARREAIKHHLNYLHLTIVEFEKIIETRHITRSGEKRGQELIEEARLVNETISTVVYLSNLRVKLHANYLKKGHNRDAEAQQELKEFFFSEIEKIEEDSLGVIEKVYYYQAYVWYSYIQLDFASCLHYASQWVSLFNDNKEMILRDVDLYMRGYHYILSSAYHLRDTKSMAHYLNELDVFRKSNYKKFNTNSQIISFLYVHTGRLNKAILNRDFEEGLLGIPRTLKRISRYKHKIDDHKVLVFYFKIAWIYFGVGNSKKAIFYLNKIINNKDINNLREDIQLYARLLFLMCHYELHNYDSLNYAINSFQPFFNRTKQDSPVQTLTLQLFKTLSRKPAFEHKEILKSYYNIFLDLQEDPFQQIAFSYLDVVGWLQTKV